VKTSSIGYIQRKLVKALEDLSIRYDGSVRDSQGNVLQRWYGEDGFQPEFIDRHKMNDCKLSEVDFKRRYGWSVFDLENKGYNKAEMTIFTQEL
jgi:DNA-directed RNA polymerase II subunit RPB1